jgi:hypothetical protein
MKKLDGHPERGGILIGMMMFIVLASLAMLTLAGRIVVEYRAVEDSVAQTRAYWAAMGFNNYVLSRTLVGGACGKNGCTGADADLSGQSSSYLQEISDLQAWFYMDIGSNYVIQLNSTVCQDSAAPMGSLGEVVIKTAFSGNGGGGPSAPGCPPAATVLPTCKAPAAIDAATIDALRSLPAARPVEFRYCLVASGITTCGAGPANGTLGGRQLVTSVHRPAC